MSQITSCLPTMQELQNLNRVIFLCDEPFHRCLIPSHAGPNWREQGNVLIQARWRSIASPRRIVGKQEVTSRTKIPDVDVVVHEKRRYK
jgi:hypothetical protein